MTPLQSIYSEQKRTLLSKDSASPLYFQLYKLLKDGILDGTFPNGTRLPTEKELSIEFGISRITAKRSLDELANDKLVERHRGKGTHVIYEYKFQPVYAPLVGMLQEIESMARNSRAVVLDIDMLQPPEKIRGEFGLEAGKTVLYLERVRERDDLRFGYYASWTLGVEQPRNAKIFINNPRLAYFRENGLEISHVKQTLSAVGAPRQATDALGVEEGAPLLILTRRSFNLVKGEERLMDYLQVLYHPERFQYSMELSLDD